MIFAISALIIAIAMSINTVLNTLANAPRKIFKCYEMTHLNYLSDSSEEEEIDYTCEEEKSECDTDEPYWFDLPVLKKSKSDTECTYDINSPNIKRPTLTKRPTLSKPINIIEKYNNSSIY